MRLVQAGHVRLVQAVTAPDDIGTLFRLPYDEAVPRARAVLTELAGLPDHELVGRAEEIEELGRFLWDDTGRRDLVDQDLGDARYEEAYDRLLPLVDLPAGPACFPDFVEAAARSGRPDVAEPYVADLEARARTNGSAWCAGVAARSRALVEPAGTAERHYRSAIELLAGTKARADLARAHLLYAEWLRLADRHPEADRQLETASDLLELTGVTTFATRTGRPTPSHALTPAELSIARLVGEGRTSAEIGGRLLISPNTVDHHLRNIFRKLGISSRRQLEELAAA